MGAGRTEKLDAEDLTRSAVRFKFSLRKTCEQFLIDGRSIS